MTEAKGEATFIIEPTNSNIDASSGFVVRKRFQDTETTTTYTTNVSTMFDDVLDQMTRPTGSSSNMKGGLLYLKNGTYTLDTGGIFVSDSTDAANIHLRMVGESRDRTIIKNGFTGTAETITCYCTTDVENLTINGNSAATIGGINTNVGNVAPNKILRVNKVRFTNIEGFPILNATYQNGLDVSECIFENPQNTNDMFAFECTGFGHIHHNLFDRSTGTTDGELLTSGSAKNVNIHDNIFISPDHDNVISIEGFDAHNNYENIFIHDNLVKGGTIVVGSSGTWSETFTNIAVMNNHVYEGSIVVRGPDSSYGTLVKDVFVENNTVIDAWQGGINTFGVGGFCTVRNNSIRTSNKSSDAFTGDKGGITLEKSTDVICENNFIYMGVVSPNDVDVSPYGIKYIDLVNPTIRNNRIINRTTAPNPNYISEGTHTGIKLISRST